MLALAHAADTVTGADDPDDFDASTDSGLYDPAIASDGLTIDTAFGPVDRVVIERALRDDGHAVVMTEAEFAYLLTVLPPTLTAARPVAAALNVSADAPRKRAHGAPITARKIA
ncbi:MAG TPA: hypothetical protein VGS97_05170 [Actinocrinis sp.]|uniref:hypothetical protein n=1 Tax=Actinocrinis sp. TaxID=1920516 RepID=UPI002DDC9357|nr:hypothetical protein [Actinocrinis sp.]HEV2343464.1 hypothetical protein [Actinocrinis sp.]